MWTTKMKNNNTSTKLVLAIVKAKSGIATGGKYYSVIRNYINKNIFFCIFGEVLLFFSFMSTLCSWSGCLLLTRSFAAIISFMYAIFHICCTMTYQKSVYWYHVKMHTVSTHNKIRSFF